MKKCPRCGIPQPTSNFSKDKNKSDGLSSWCRSWRSANRRHVATGPPRTSQVKVIADLPTVIQFVETLARVGKKYVDRYAGKTVLVTERLAEIVGRPLLKPVAYAILRKFKIPPFVPAQPTKIRPLPVVRVHFSIERVEYRKSHTVRFVVVDDYHNVCGVYGDRFDAEIDVRRLTKEAEMEAQSQSESFKVRKRASQDKDQPEVEDLDDENLVNDENLDECDEVEDLELVNA